MRNGRMTGAMKMSGLIKMKKMSGRNFGQIVMGNGQLMREMKSGLMKGQKMVKMSGQMMGENSAHDRSPDNENVGIDESTKDDNGENHERKQSIANIGSDAGRERNENRRND